MSNNWFQFKQFRIDQGQCAMKVTTDACIQGAWTPVAENVKYILDIGTGTGLLALMLAQRCASAKIDAVEFDPSAARQAIENVSISVWNDRIEIINKDIRNYESSEKYDLIVCNPPFFDNALLGPRQEKNNARHTVHLSKDDLAAAIVKLLSPEGKASILLPLPEYTAWIGVAANYELFVTEVLLVRHHPNAEYKRAIAMMSTKPTKNLQEHQLTIMDENNAYTEEFKAEMRPFYLAI